MGVIPLIYRHGRRHRTSKPDVWPKYLDIQIRAVKDYVIRSLLGTLSKARLSF